MQILQMTQQDIQAVQQVATTSWHATYEGIIPQHIQRNFLQWAYSDEMLQKRLVETPFFVAKQAGEVIGFANFSHNNELGEVELIAIYVDPTKQQQGTGTQLLKVGLSLLQPQKLFVNVEQDNEIGKHFYIAKGFQVVEQFDEDFDGHILKTLRMVLVE